jgi:uncharacterized protein YecE (DUF72 family)
VRVGCSGWVYKDWRGTFYPEKLPQREWLRHYASQFDTVEINNTFYRLPSEAAVQKWVDETDDDFCFAVKASRYITHIKRLIDPEKYVQRFLGTVAPLIEAKQQTVLLWQLPPTFKRNDERLDAALTAIRDQTVCRNAVEFRHPSWFAPDVYELLNRHKTALVIADSPDYPFVKRKLTTEWTYVRMHRGTRGGRGHYSAAEIATWRRRIASWRSKAEVLVYFNNDWEAFAVDNAARLRDGLS